MKLELNKNQLIQMILGAMILSFGLYNIHQPFSITEGGVLGGILLINFWSGINASYLAIALDVMCYVFAFKYLGIKFIKKSLISTVLVASFLRLQEMFPPLISSYVPNTMVAAILGGLCVGIGVGLVVRAGGSSGGDDALALIISKKTGWKLSKSYLITDLSVLLLSLSYIPVVNIAYSLITVTISSILIDIVTSVETLHPMTLFEKMVKSNEVSQQTLTHSRQKNV